MGNYGNPGVRIANMVGEKVANSIGVQILDQFVMRSLQENDGDGIHCASPIRTTDHHLPTARADFFEVVGVSCYTSLQALLNVLAFEFKYTFERAAECEDDHEGLPAWKCPHAIRDARAPPSWDQMRYEEPQKRSA